MTKYVLAAIGLAIVAPGMGATCSAQSLRGSPASVMKQRNVAAQNDYSMVETARDVSRLVQIGVLVRVMGNVNYQLSGVSHPYARPAVLTFVERMASQYKATCGERLVVTSLTRPGNEQPRNASVESVHPAGMAVDMRISPKTTCRRWIEKTLLALEKNGVVEATRERRPAHYHIAVFPERYADYLRKSGVTDVNNVSTVSNEG